ncbi:MAG TPA: spore coat protein [Clostridia bacterium]|nr:spore coat protein [Clostridia bacterium]
MAVTFSQKEMKLLKDQKDHEQICIAKYINYANQANDSQLKAIFNASAQSEREHLDSINQLINGQVPQLNKQGGSGQAAGGQASAAAGSAAMNAGMGGSRAAATGTSRNASAGMSNAQAGISGSSDKDMCTDMLMTEKYVSGAYDTSIFEFQNTNVRDVLNHIQKEEQKHGEAISQYMQQNGMYNVQ